MIIVLGLYLFSRLLPPLSFNPDLNFVAFGTYSAKVFNVSGSAIFQSRSAKTYMAVRGFFMFEPWLCYCT